MSAREDDSLTLVVSADREDEIHVHGYDLHAAVAAGETAELTIDLDRAGRFEVELHDTGLQLTVLEVQPR